METTTYEIDLLTIDAAAAELNVTRAAVYQAVKEGRLPSVRVLGKTGVRRSDLSAYRPRTYRERLGSKPVGRSKKSNGE